MIRCPNCKIEREDDVKDCPVCTTAKDFAKITTKEQCLLKGKTIVRKAPASFSTMIFICGYLSFINGVWSIVESTKALLNSKKTPLLKGETIMDWIEDYAFLHSKIAYLLDTPLEINSTIFTSGSISSDLARPRTNDQPMFYYEKMASYNSKYPELLATLLCSHITFHGGIISDPDIHKYYKERTEDEKELKNLYRKFTQKVLEIYPKPFDIEML